MCVVENNVWSMQLAGSLSLLSIILQKAGEIFLLNGTRPPLAQKTFDFFIFAFSVHIFLM